MIVGTHLFRALYLHRTQWLVGCASVPTKSYMNVYSYFVFTLGDREGDEKGWNRWNTGTPTFPGQALTPRIRSRGIRSAFPRSQRTSARSTGFFAHRQWFFGSVTHRPGSNLWNKSPVRPRLSRVYTNCLFLISGFYF
jgi:hypothetical protein